MSRLGLTFLCSCLFAPCMCLEGIGETTEALRVVKMSTFVGQSSISIYIDTCLQRNLKIDTKEDFILMSNTITLSIFKQKHHLLVDLHTDKRDARNHSYFSIYLMF